MLFEELHIRNFGSIRDITLSLADQGLKLIVGRNEDHPKANSNGAGKSLLLDALVWCIWGQTIRGNSFDAVVNRFEGKDCFVSLTFQEKASKYQIIRYRNQTQDLNYKPNDLVLLVRGKDCSGTSISATQQTINDIIGFDFDTFCALMPGAGIKVAELTDLKIKELLEKILQTQLLGKAYKNVGVILKDLAKKITVLEAKLTGLDSSIKEGEHNLDELKYSFDTFEYRKFSRILEIKSTIESTTKELDTIKESLQSKDLLCTQIQEATDRKANALATVCALNGELAQIKEEGKQQISEIKNAHKECDFLILEAQKRLKKLDSLTGTCSICEQEIDDTHLDTQRSIVYTELDAIENKRAMIPSFTEEDIFKLQQTTLRNLAVAESDYKLAETGLTRLQRKSAELDVAVVIEKNLVSKLGQLNNELSCIQKDTNPFKPMILSLEEQLNIKKKDRNSKQKELTKCQHNEQIYSFWLQGFSPSGLRSFMLEHVTPILNSAAKKYATLLTGQELEVTFHTKEQLKNNKSKEKFNIKVVHKHGGDSYTSSSTGERGRANLVIALALGDLAAMRINKHVPFRFLDEPFESIDELGTEAIVQLLNQHQDMYDTVFVITHQDHFKQLFLNKLTIVKTKGYSRLEE